MFSALDIDWLNTNHPKMHFDGEKIEGWLSFAMSYDTITGSYTIQAAPESSLEAGKIFHFDTYKLQLYFGKASYPQCLEIGGAIEATSKRRHISKPDLHVNGDHTLCLEALQELEGRFEDEFSLQVYVDEYLIPFLFQQTHMRLEGVWAWPPRPHMAAGPLEWYYDSQLKDDRIVQARTLYALSVTRRESISTVVAWVKEKQYNRNHPCLCGRKIPIARCCPKALYGFKRLRKELFKQDTTLRIHEMTDDLPLPDSIPAA